MSGMVRFAGGTLGMLVLAAGACADPCVDDGFGQELCPAVATMGDATGSGGSSGDAHDSTSASMSGADGDASQSGTTSVTATDSETATTGTGGETEATTGPRTQEFCADDDGDGFGDPDECMDADPADPPPGTVPNDDDCDDNNPAAFPGAAQDEDPRACMEDADDDGWGDNNPPPGVEAGSDCDDDAMGTVLCALLVTQDGTPNNPYDQGLISALTGLNFAISNVEDAVTTAADADFMSVVVISETAFSGAVAAKFVDVTVPVVCLEGLVWDDMQMAPTGIAAPVLDIEILDPAHALAGGLSGIHTVIGGTGSGLFHTAPSAAPAIVASVAANPTQITLFGFDTGAPMESGFPAPARRVGYGLDADQSGPPDVMITADGLTLFEAAVLWATG